MGRVVLLWTLTSQCRAHPLAGVYYLIGQGLKLRGVKNEECRLRQTVSHSDEEISPDRPHELLTCSSLLPVSFCHLTASLRARETEFSQFLLSVTFSNPFTFLQLCMISYVACYYYFTQITEICHLRIDQQEYREFYVIVPASVCLQLSFARTTVGLFFVNTHTLRLNPT